MSAPPPEPPPAAPRAPALPALTRSCSPLCVCAACRYAKVRCDRSFPCTRCVRLGRDCVKPKNVPRGRPSKARLLERALQQQLQAAQEKGGNREAEQQEEEEQEQEEQEQEEETVPPPFLPSTTTSWSQNGTLSSHPLPGKFSQYEM